MSFNFSARDFIAVGQLTWTIYKACKGATGEFQELSRELSSLQTIIRELQDEAESPTSLLNRRGTGRKPELDKLLENISGVLRQIDDLVKRYHSLGRDQKKTWNRVKFAAEDLAALREKLTFHINAIELFISSLSASSLARIEGILDELVRDIKAGKKEPSIISTCEEEDEVAWDELERELVGDGITRQNIEKYKEAIKEYLKKLIQENVMGNGYGPEASLSGTFDEVELENGVFHEESVPPGWTALHTAAESGDETVVQLLLKEGADVAAKDWFQWTALHPAAKNGHEVVVQLLLEKGADVTASDHIGRTALHRAAENGHEAVVRLLLGKGADVAAKDNVGRTALYWAAENGHEAIVRLLHEKGTDVAAKDNIGRIALHRTAEKGQEAAVRLLLEKGVDVTASDVNGRTALHWAAENGHKGVVRLLLQNGADVTAIDSTQRTAEDWAAENGQEAMVRLLTRARRSSAVGEASSLVQCSFVDPKVRTIVAENSD